MFVLVYGLTKVKQSSETRIYPDELKVGCNICRPGLIRPVTFLCSCHCFVNLVPRSLVDEAEGEIRPNPICIT